MKVMIHKIHNGPNLPSVQAGTPYQIIGYRQSVHDYSHVEYPQDMRNCVRCHTAETPGGSVWMTEPNRDACGSCHDNINWEVAGEGHPVAQFDDSLCAACHIPQGENEFDISIMGAHTIPAKSSQLAGTQHGDHRCHRRHARRHPDRLLHAHRQRRRHDLPDLRLPHSDPADGRPDRRHHRPHGGPLAGCA